MAAESQDFEPKKIEKRRMSSSRFPQIPRMMCCISTVVTWVRWRHSENV